MGESISFVPCLTGQLQSKTFTNTGCQLFRIERFGQIIVCLKQEPLQAVGFVTAVGEEKDKDVLVGFADSFGHFKAVQSGHVDVKQHQIGLDKRKLFKGNTPIAA